jgi:hypothetical protein
MGDDANEASDKKVRIRSKTTHLIGLSRLVMRQWLLVSMESFAIEITERAPPPRCLLTFVPLRGQRFMN